MLCVFAGLCLSAVYEPPILTDRNFESSIAKSPLTFVMTYRKDVRFSTELLPKFRAVAEMMKDKCQCVILDYEKSEKMRKKYEIFAVPSFFVFRKGVYSAEYAGERDAKSMLNFLKRISGPSVIELESARDVFDFLESTKNAVVLAGEEIDDDLMKAFTAVAANLTDVTSFALAKSPDAIQQLALEETPSLVLHRNEDKTVLDYNLAFGVKEANLRTWIVQNLKARYHERDAIIFRDLAFDKRYAFLAFYDSSKKTSTDLMHQTLDKIYTTYGENFTYVYSDIYDMGTLCLQMGFSGVREPMYAIARLAGGEIKERYLFPEMRQPTPNNLVKWVAKFMNGSIKPKIHSEKEPEHQEGPMFKKVGHTWLNAIRDVENDLVTLILMGTNETERAIALNVLNETAHEFKNQGIESVKFYHIDAEVNELLGISLDGREPKPLFLLWPAGEERRPMALGDTDVYSLMSTIVSYGHNADLKKFQIPTKYDEGSLEL